jgi:hypothetical protein
VDPVTGKVIGKPSVELPAAPAGVPSPGAAKPAIPGEMIYQLLQDLSTNTRTPRLLHSYQELQDPKVIREIIANNNGLALLNGMVFKVSLEKNERVATQGIEPTRSRSK